MGKVYCKYCYSYVGLEPGDGVWVCSNCNYGLAPMDSGGGFGGHPSYSKFRTCIEGAFIVMNMGMHEKKLKGNAEDMKRYYPECPHKNGQNKKLYDQEELIQHMRQSVGLPPLEM